MGINNGEFYRKMDLGRNISSTAAFTIVLVLSFLVALYTLNAARNVETNFPDSEIVKIEKRPASSDLR